MSDFEINKGVGREVEFKGLRAQYLFIFAFGLLAVFVVFVIMYTAGIGQWTCIGFGVSATTAVVWLTFSLNRRFGSHGLMKLLAARQHPRRILSRKRITRLIKKKTIVNHEKYIDNIHTGKQIPRHGGGTRLHRQQGRRHHGGFPGDTAGSVFGIIRGI